MTPRFFLLIIFLSFSNPVLAKQGSTLCDIFDFPNCAGVTKVSRRSTQQSLPSTATSASLNPATVSFDKGFGIESIHQNSNSSTFNLITGSERLGGVLVNSNLENSFFSHRTPETDEERLQRELDQKQFSSEKMNFALGTRIVKKKTITFDSGLLFKYNNTLRTLNPGIGFSSKFNLLSIGGSYFQDDFYLEDTNYHERFHLFSYSTGIRLGSFAFDFGSIYSKLKYYNSETSKIHLYSVAYTYRNTLLNLGVRNEKSSFPKFVNNELKTQPTKSDFFSSLQLSLGKHLILAINYNYFLLREFSLTTALFY
jgi:hypothetical protein